MEAIIKSYRKLVDRFGQYEMNQILDFNTFVKQCETFGIKSIEKDVISLFIE